MSGTEREQVAYHEAGHFVASYMLTPSSYRATVSIRPSREEGTEGHCFSEGPWCEEQYLAEPVIYFAGFAAERRYNPNADPRGSGLDGEKAREILELLGDVALEDEYRAKADTLIADHWAEVEALAEELLRQETITAPGEAEIVIDIARGEATVEDLARYRALKTS